MAFEERLVSALHSSLQDTNSVLRYVHKVFSRVTNAAYNIAYASGGSNTRSAACASAGGGGSGGSTCRLPRVAHEQLRAGA